VIGVELARKKRLTAKVAKKTRKERKENHLHLRGKEEILKSLIGGRDWTKSVS